MTETGKMVLKLVVLIAPSLIVLGTLYLGQKGNGIGGGSYDLSEMVYSLLLALFILGWNVWVLVSLYMAKTNADKLNNKILLVIGVVALISAFIWFFKQLT